MQWHIIKDKEDLYVLSINNIVVLISRDINAITKEIQDDVANRKINPRRTYNPAIIDIELPNNKDKLVIIGKLPEKAKPVREERGETASISTKINTLGKLFEL